LSDVVVVIEARLQSGTLITVDMALEQGKEVYAVPGRVTERLSDGCNKLIKEGAIPFLAPDEFIQEILERKEALMMYKRVERKKGKSLPNPDKTVLQRESNEIRAFGETQEKAEKGRYNQLTQEQQRVYEQLEIMPKSVDEMMKALKDMSIDTLLCVIMELQMKGLAGMRGNAYYKILR
jgi:DNA processing protein